MTSNRPSGGLIQLARQDQPTIEEHFRLRPDAELLSGVDGGLILRQGRFEVIIDPSSLARRVLLLRLAENWLAEDELNRLLASTAGEQGILQGQILLRRLLAHSWLCRRLDYGDRPLLSIAPHGAGLHTASVAQPTESQPCYWMSRFAISSMGEGGLSFRSPRSSMTITLNDPLLGGVMVTAAADGCDPASVQQAANLSASAAAAVIEQLIAGRILVDRAEHESERESSPQVFWQAEELAMHTRSRAGLHVMPIGGTYRFRGRIAPEPLTARRAGESREPLPVPDLARICREERSLTQVVAERRSIREHDDAAPISREQLSEFLYRVQHTWDVGSADGMETGRRPYPSAGRICELEVYPLISRCAGVEGGFYHYESVEHALVRISALNADANRMLNYARSAAAAPANPQVLLVVSARIPRLMWKYEGLGYSLILKNAGVLTELMYLVATSMGLAPCALGSGDADGFSALSGLDQLAEPSVAEFMLGSVAE